MRTLYANGCSFTYGSEIIAGVDEALIPAQKRWSLSWPGQLGRELGFDRVFNDGVPCSSNDRVVRTTIRWVLHELAAGVAPADLFVVIGWSSPMRREFRINGSWRQLVPHHDYHDLELDIFARTYRELAWDPVEAAVRFATQLVVMQSFLRANHIEHLFFDALEPLARTRSACPELVDGYLSSLDRARYFQFMVEDGALASLGPAAQRRHPTPEEHAAWARELARFCAAYMAERPAVGASRLEGAPDVPMLDIKRGRSDRPQDRRHDVATIDAVPEPSFRSRMSERIRAAFRRDPFIYD